MLGNKTIFLFLLGVIIIAWIASAIAHGIEKQQENGASRGTLITYTL